MVEFKPITQSFAAKKVVLAEKPLIGRFKANQQSFTTKDIVLAGSVADPGSGAFLTPGSGIRNRFFPDPGSQIHIFESLVTVFLGKKFYNSLKIGPNFFLHHFKTKVICNFVKFVAT